MAVNDLIMHYENRGRSVVVCRNEGLVSTIAKGLAEYNLATIEEFPLSSLSPAVQAIAARGHMVIDVRCGYLFEVDSADIESLRAEVAAQEAAAAPDG